MKRRTRSWLQAVGFAALALGGVGVGLWRAEVGVSELGAALELGLWAWAGLLAVTAGIFASDAWRYRAMARAVDTEIGWGTGWNASISCHFFSCITPGAALGAPAAVAMLARDGVDLPTAAVVSFGKSMLGSTALFVGAFGFLAVGLGPQLPAAIGALLLWGLGVVSAILLGMLALGAMPVRARRLVERWEALWSGRSGGGVARALGSGVLGAVERIARFRPSAMPEVIASQALHYGMMVGLLVLLAWLHGAQPLSRVAGTSWIYLAFLYVAPTPGGAGLAESTAVDFFGAVLPAAEAIAVVLLYRALAFYAFVGIGAVHLLWVGGLDASSAD